MSDALTKHRNKISGQFASRLIEMLESPAYRVLSLAAHRVLSRIEIEFAHHGGKDNGKLTVTFKDFGEYGLARKTIGPAIAETAALGFIEITQQGRPARSAEYRVSNRFLLTTRPELEGVGPERCQWRRFKTLEEAQHVADIAREVAKVGRGEGGANLKAAGGKREPLAVEKGNRSRPLNGGKREPQQMGKRETTIYISGG